MCIFFVVKGSKMKDENAVKKGKCMMCGGVWK